MVGPSAVLVVVVVSEMLSSISSGPGTCSEGVPVAVVMEEEWVPVLEEREEVMPPQVGRKLGPQACFVQSVCQTIFGLQWSWAWRSGE